MDAIRRSAAAFAFPFGAVAQLGERLPCTQEVRSSILLGSTILRWRTRAGIGSQNPSAWLKAACLDFGFLPFFKQSILDEAKRLSLGRRTSNFGSTCGVREVRRTKRDAYQLEVEKCVCAAARSAALWPWTTRVVAVTGKSGECSSTVLPSSCVPFLCSETPWGEQGRSPRGFGYMVK